MLFVHFNFFMQVVLIIYEILSFSGMHNNDERVILIMLTIYHMYKEHAIQLFLETAIM